MFTGLVTAQGTIERITATGDLRVAVRDFAASLGASIAVNGICLTVTASDAHGFSAQLSPETRTRTTAQHWATGDAVNLEPSLRMGDELGGHLVSGHVDGVAEIISITESGNAWNFTFAAPSELMRFIAVKGSVTLDGVSLTVNEVSGDNFSVTIIPHTHNVTTFSQKKPGDAVNLEVDMLARYVDRLTNHDSKRDPCQSRITNNA